MGPAGFVALLAGWMVTEVGRQPLTVYGVLRTADSVSPIAGRRRSRISLLAFVARLLRCSARASVHPAADEPAAASGEAGPAAPTSRSRRRHHAGAALEPGRPREPAE